MIYLRRVSGDSMQPKLKNGQIILAVSFKRPKTGNVVIFRHNGLEKIKRLVKIRQDEVYILGDNPQLSTDSRTFGWLPISAVKAKVIWPRF